MGGRYLFGPITGTHVGQDPTRHRQQGRCLTFDQAGKADVAIGPGDTWDEVCSRLPAGWRPDFVVLALAYNTIPSCLWSAPVPLIGLADDWNLLWHDYRYRLPQCDLVLTDSNGVEALARAGIGHARAANLFGCGRAYLEQVWPNGQRDIDILFVGNFNPAVQRERMAWLGRLARLGNHRRVVLTSGVFGDAYRALLGRARIVFNRSLRGECNLRTFEAAAAGALLFQEAGNREVPRYFRDRLECVYYDTDNLEELLGYYLDHEEERRAIAEAAQAKVREYSFENFWDEALAGIESAFPTFQERARQRLAGKTTDNLTARTWQMLGSSAGTDPTLAADLAQALVERPLSGMLHNALGLVTALTPPGNGKLGLWLEKTAGYFQRALTHEPGHLVAGLNLVEVLVRLGKKEAAIPLAHSLLAALERQSELGAEVLDAGHFPVDFDWFRVEWERAAWSNAGRPDGEVQAKRVLLRWRLHLLLGELTGQLSHYYEAALARPDLAVSQAALGCALGRAQQPAQAIPHLRQAVAANPFDVAAARALFQALGDAGDGAGQQRLAEERRLLVQAAPGVVPMEPWIARTPGPIGKPTSQAILTPSPQPLSPKEGRGALQISSQPFSSNGRGALQITRLTVSLCMIVKNEEANLPACLLSAADLVDEIIVVDTGSTDTTKEVAGQFQARLFDFPWVDDFAAARNECLRHATGDWIFWLDADDRLDEDNRHKLRDLFAGLKDDNAAYTMKCLCLPDPRTGTATVVDHVRLFRNRPEVRWQYRVHEQILPAVRRSGGEVRKANVVIHHVGYQDAALRGRKQERDLRLLLLDQAERPDDPFTLFNLGWNYVEMGRVREALPVLRRSLEGSQPGDSIVRKLFALLMECHHRLGQGAEALAVCQEGRRFYPDDAQLLFQEGVLRGEQGDDTGAEACWVRLVGKDEEPLFASVAEGLRGHKARHHLAILYHHQGRQAEAEAQWKAALAEQPNFTPAWLGLGEL